MRSLFLLLTCSARISADPILEEFAASPAFKTASLGVSFIPLDEDAPALTLQADTALIPASTMKAISTATALQLLGEDFRFETRLYLKGDDLIVKGGGDPTLAATGIEADFPEWLASLQEAGVTEIKGDLIADPSRFESRTTSDNWPWGDVGNYYGSGPSGLNFHRNSFDLTFQPAGVGEKAELISTLPTPPGVEIENEMRTGPAESGDRGSVYSGPGAKRISLRGTVPAGGPFTIRGALPDPPLLCALSLKKYLTEHGIPVVGEARVAATDLEGATLVHTLESPSFAKIINATNHRSVNLYADSLFKSLSPEGTTEASAALLKNHWTEQGIDLTGFVLHDGSGLSPRDLVTARQLALILKKARAHETGELFYQSLPPAGKEGSMAVFGRDTDLAGRARIKPGGLTGVRTYAGYLTASSGREFAFAILTNNSVADPDEAIANLLVNFYQSR